MIWDMGVWEAVSGSGALGHRGVSRGVSGSPWPSEREQEPCAAQGCGFQAAGWRLSIEAGPVLSS